MQFTFLDMAGKVLFIREDAERASWTTEEMSLDLEFPYLSDKVVSIGQRVFFIDTVGKHQIYEVKQAKTVQPDGFQQITAEHICISELSDEHVDEKEITNKTCSSALAEILSGTLWSVGTKGVNPTSSADLSRGSVWQAVLQIKDNWNVYIEPRVTLSSDGTISRHLDIISTAGVWNGLRLSIDKNMLDPSVTYDDSNVATALYGYGGTIHDPHGKEEDKECDFSDVVWTKTADHPAKPKGQKYIEDPDATADYGRNGRARFSFYQNNDITDPEILLQKTWETLKTVMTPDISIDGTVTDLYRMGYADQPIALHDIALVEVLPAGFKKQIQIIRLTVDLLDPSASSMTIGSYIPNIIYIQRQTDMDATGSRGGGGGNKSKETEKAEFEAQIQSINAGTGLRFTAFQRDLDKLDEDVKLQEAAITVEHNRITQEVVDRREADTQLATTYDAKITVEARRITQEVTERKNGQTNLQSQITQQAGQIELKVSKGSVISSINQSAESITISAARVNLSGYTTLTDFNALSGTVDGILAAGTFGANKITSTSINATGTLAASSTFNYKGHTVGTYACTTNGGTTFYALGYT